MTKVGEVLTQLLLSAVILLLLTFLATRFAMKSLFLGAQSALAIASPRKPASR